MHPLAGRLRLPFGLILLVLGFIVSELVTMLGFDTGIRWYNVNVLILHVILPALIFYTALQLNLESIRQYATSLFLLALPLMLLGLSITAVLLYYGIGHEAGFPWIIAWLAAALLSATDPTAVVDTMRKAGSENLATLVESEGLLNDATAIMLFGILISVALLDKSVYSAWSHAIPQFILVFAGGLLIGLIAGLVASFLLYFIHDYRLAVMTTIIIAYIAYLVAYESGQVSGVMAILACGLVISRYQNNLPTLITIRIEESWSLIAFVAMSAIYLLAGVTITLDMFSDQWLAMLIAIISVLIARFCITSVLWLLGIAWPKAVNLKGFECFLLGWGGLRGAVTLALVLSLPLELASWYTVQSMAYGVVLFGLVFQASTMHPLIRFLYNRGHYSSHLN